jgi:PKD repeat protein
VVQPSGGDYASFQYSWDFGDSSAGTWTTNGKSRNTATGYTAAHVFQAPGTYTVTLTVTDGATSDVHVYEQTITASAISGTTYYVDSVAGNDSNNGTSTTSAWKTASKAFSSGAKTNAQVLFKRGQTFSFNGSLTISAAGPGIIGAFGTGAKPVLQNSATDARARSAWRATSPATTTSSGT